MDYQQIVSKAKESLFIIGEVGVNHNGDIDTAKKLIDVAKLAGCDAVKFQTWITEHVYCKALSIKPEYQLKTTDKTESEFDTIKKLELSFEDFTELKVYCDQIGILFLSTPDESMSVDFLCDSGVSLLKVGSQDVTNIPFLRYVAHKQKPIILSLGASTLSESIEAIETILDINQELVIFHCVTSYPAPIDELNLRCIPKYADLYSIPVGFSDHTTGVEAACVSLGLGAIFFEKHFTFDPNAEGPDHQASLSPEKLKEYIDTLRRCYSALGDGKKKIMPCEESNRKALSRYLVTAQTIKKGQILQVSDFHFKKVVSGIPAKLLDRVMNGVAEKDIPEDTVLEWSMFTIIQ